MSTKPPDVGRFAVGSNDLDAGNLTIPLSGQRDTGWTHGQQPPSGIENYLQNIAYRWRKYLADGAFSGDHSIAGKLSVSGDVSSTGKLSVSGDVSSTGKLSVSGDVAVGGDASLVGTLGVHGNVTMNRALAVAGDVTIAGGCIATSYRHGVITETFSAITGIPFDNIARWFRNSDGMGIMGPAPLQWAIPIRLPAKKTIRAIRARVKAGLVPIAAAAWKVGGANGAVGLGIGTTKTLGQFETFLVANDIAEQIEPGFTYQVHLGSAADSPGNCEYVYVEVDYDQVI
jgi:cytoskeletal protein CcmA (bactofilin family)